MAKEGKLSINSENIFPIIKKWMYSDQDIFVREQISNACDAITKLEKLSLISKWTKPEGYKGRVDVIVNSDERTLTFKDNGIGMTEEEVSKYINEIAFSGATDFINRYKDKANDDQIIGHFGLGFYSAFMVADLVTIDTLSYKEGAKAVHWECNGGTDYRLSEGDKKDIGTIITLHLNDESLQYSNEWEIRMVIEKYCSFMPYEIYVEKLPVEDELINPEDKLDTDKVIETVPAHKDGDREVKEQLKIERRPVLMNDTSPLWTRVPSDCKDEEYKEFYTKVFRDYKEPLFWIHLNMDYPYNLKGILYFPKINMEYESIEGTIKLYNNRVFIADNIKEVIPEYLMLLKGVIDCPDLPLNVSRSQLQNDGFVEKISNYIIKKVADKLSGMCKVDRENYEKYWNDISPFIKYGCLRDTKFMDRMRDYVLFEDLEGKYITVPQCLEEDKEAKDTEENKENEKVEEKKKYIYYVTDPVLQSQYMNLFKEEGKNAVLLTRKIDQPFIQQLEAGNPGISFRRIDSDIEDEFKEEISEDEEKKLEEKSKDLTEEFKKILAKETVTVKIQKMKNENLASMISISEDSRRMNDMMKMYAASGLSMGDRALPETLILNSDHRLVKYLLSSEDKEGKELIAKQLYDLARIQNSPLKADEMAEFIGRSNDVLSKVIG